MNKAKLVKLGEEVLREIDLEMESLIRTETEKKLCRELSNFFHEAWIYLENCENEYSRPIADEKINNYKSVKPILDDVIGNSLNKIKKMREDI